MFTKRNAIAKVRQFLLECDRLPIEIDKAILFGSVITGNANEQSDIDLALFSKKFGDNILQNIDLIGSVNIRYPEIDVHTFNTGEQKKKGVLLEEIFKTGIEVII